MFSNSIKYSVRLMKTYDVFALTNACKMIEITRVTNTWGREIMRTHIHATRKVDTFTACPLDPLSHTSQPNLETRLIVLTEDKTNNGTVTDG